MISTVSEVALTLAGQYGLVLLFAVFVFEGAIIGKLVPTRLIFVAVALAVGTDAFALASVVAVAVVGATAGQCVLFAVTRRTEGRLETAGGAADSDRRRFPRGQRWFDRWGLTAVALSNSVPFVRGTLTVPTALSDRSGYRFFIASTAGTVGYVTLLLAVSLGLGGLAGTPV